MKRNIRFKFHFVILLLAALLLCSLSVSAEEWVTDSTAPERSTAAYIPSTAYEARCVPTYIWRDTDFKEENGEEVQMLYNPETAKMAIDLSVASYNIQDDETSSDDWMSLMESYGYSQLVEIQNNAYPLGLITVNGDNGSSTVPKYYKAINALIGIQKVTYNGQPKYAVAVAFRGTDTNDLADIITDAMVFPAEDFLHKGFSDNARDFYENICKTVSFEIDGTQVSLSEIIQEMQLSNSKYCMLVTGHSLGGAIADVFVGHELYEAGVHPTNVVAYTFAPAKSASTFYDYPYTNIFNIINNDDLVPHVGADKQIGTNLYFTPSDSFRQTYYNHFEAEHDSAWWRNLVNTITMGFSPHNSGKVYRNIEREIAADLSSYIAYSTSGKNTWTRSITLTDTCFGNFNDSIEIISTPVFEQYSLHVGGDLTLKYSLVMQNPSDYLLVNGDLTVGAWTMAENHLSAGTVELKGDFTSEWGYNDLAYHETGSHKTIFSGSGIQNIRVQCSQFENLYLENPYVNFETSIPQLKLREDTTIYSTARLHISNTLELNGYTLNLEYPSVEMEVNGVNTLNGKLLVSGNFLSTNTLLFDRAELRIAGHCEMRQSFSMQHEDDYLLVCGDFIVKHGDANSYALTTNHLTAGTVELKGDYIQHNGNGSPYYAYYETGTHKTIFSGTDLQEITMSNTREIDQFYNLILENPKVNLGIIHRMRLGADAVNSATERLVINSLLDLNGHTLSLPGDASIYSMQTKENDTGHLQVTGNLFLNNTAVSGRITVDGNLNVTQPLTFADAVVTVGGNCKLSESLVMHHPNDYLLVSGNLDLEEHMASDLPEDHLTAGAVEIKGWFRVGSDGRTYWETGTHRTIFSGAATQDIYLNNTVKNRFWNPLIKNPLVQFRSDIAYLSLEEDTTITGTSSLKIGLLLHNGYKLHFSGTLKTDAQIGVNSGIVSVSSTAAEKDPVHVLVSGYDSMNRMTVCTIVTVHSAAAAAEIDIRQWDHCAIIKTYILGSEYAPMFPALSIQ